jgi:hypothetical protein
MRLFLATAALIVTALTMPARADDQQPGPPVPLVEPQNNPPAPNPPQSAPDVQAAPLAAIDPSWTGILGEGDKPLPAAMWQGTKRVVVRAALPLLGPTDSPALQSLSRRLLLSSAVPPEGDDPAGQPGLLALRLKALAAIGAVPGALAVMTAIPPGKHDETADRLRTELGFATGDRPGACHAVGEGIAKYQNVWWDRAQIACQMLAGDRGGAALSLDLLRERDTTPDPGFETLMAAAGGKPVKLEKGAELSPLRVSLWAAGKRPLPDDALAGADLMTLASFAIAAPEPPANRLTAAERAAALGALAPDRLGEIYGKIDFKEEERTNAFADDKLGDTPRGRALLYAIAQKDGDPAIRAEALNRFLEAARRHDLYFAAARLAAPMIAGFTPGDAFKAEAPNFVRAAVAASAFATVDAWLPVADPAEMGPLVTLMRAVAGPRARPDDKTMAEAMAALALRTSDTAPRQMALFQMLAGEFWNPPAPEELAAEMAPSHPGNVPNEAVWVDQQQAQAERRSGETVLMSLIIAADKTRLTPEPIALHRAISGLRAVGLEADARALALEAAIAAGL